MPATVKKIPLFILVGFFLTALLTIAFFENWKRPKLERIVIGDAQQVSFGLLYVALAKGYFRDEGLDVVLAPYPSGRDALKAAIAGKVDLATSYETPIVLQAIDGQDLAVLTSLHEATHNTALVARKNSGIESIEDLRGKRVGVTPKSTSHFLATSMIRSAGLGLRKVKFVSLEPGDMLRALKSETVDAVVTWNPHLIRIQNTLPPSQIKVFYSDDYVEMSMLVGLRSRVVAKGAPFTKLLRALFRAEQLEYDNPEEVVSIITRELGNQFGTAKEISVVSKSLRRGLKLNNVLLAIMQQEAEWYEALESSHPPLVDISHVLYPSLLEKVSYEAVTLSEKPAWSRP